MASNTRRTCSSAIRKPRRSCVTSWPNAVCRCLRRLPALRRAARSWTPTTCRGAGRIDGSTDIGRHGRFGLLDFVRGELRKMSNWKWVLARLFLGAWTTLGAVAALAVLHAQSGQAPPAVRLYVLDCGTMTERDGVAYGLSR